MTEALLPRGLDLRGRRVLVLGLGITGREVARILADRGAGVLVSDRGEVDPADRDALEAAGAEVEAGTHDRARACVLDGAIDLVVPSPGVSPVTGLLAEIARTPTPIFSELDLGARLTDAPVVAVTGTNGKTTVCRLAELMGREAGLDVVACGNLETKFVTAAFERPDADAFVVEASSFALATCRIFRPRVAVITNLAPDHLDWHGTFEHYRDSKARIAARQGPGDVFLYPAAQPELAGIAPGDGPARVRFGDAPVEGEGAWVDADRVVVRMAGLTLEAGGVAALSKRGRHFASDAAAAAAAMAVLGVGAPAIERALDGFSFDAHRLDRVGVVGGICVVDDSVATNPHATLAALRSFDEPIVLIAGGRNKGLDLSPLAAEAGRLRAVVTIGEASEELGRVFSGSGVFVSKAASMREAVAMALKTALPGDVVLLSCACASHDMFANYAERGRAFRRACGELGVSG